MTTLSMQLADIPIQVSEESLREIERFVVVLYYCIDKSYSLEVHDHKQIWFSTQDYQSIRSCMGSMFKTRASTSQSLRLGMDK